jgi:hypothetical protein
MKEEWQEALVVGLQHSAVPEPTGPISVEIWGGEIDFHLHLGSHVASHLK